MQKLTVHEVSDILNDRRKMSTTDSERKDKWLKDQLNNLIEENYENKHGKKSSGNRVPGKAGSDEGNHKDRKET